MIVRNVGKFVLEQAVNDMHIDACALGLLVWLQSRSNGSELSSAMIGARFDRGTEWTRSTLKRLVASGYVERPRQRVTRGRFEQRELIVRGRSDPG